MTGSPEPARTVDVVLGRGVRADLELVDALARLQLAAGRLGCAVRLHGACDDLRSLLDLVGLSDVMREGEPLRLELLGEPEEGEQLGVEEVVEPGDPAV
jgi:hypothetical protein